LLPAGDDDQDAQDGYEGHPGGQAERPEEELGDEQHQLKAEPEGQRDDRPIEQGAVGLQSLVPNRSPVRERLSPPTTSAARYRT
jgi:hypothetical protein